jgi:hypothetical protein
MNRCFPSLRRRAIWWLWKVPQTSTATTITRAMLSVHNEAWKNVVIISRLWKHLKQLMSASWFFSLWFLLTTTMLKWSKQDAVVTSSTWGVSTGYIWEMIIVLRQNNLPVGRSRDKEERTKVICSTALSQPFSPRWKCSNRLQDLSIL